MIKPILGIDLGCTNSAVAIMQGGKPEIIVNSEGERTTPSIVAYTKKGELLVGHLAKRQAVVNPENTFYSVKRFIGRKTSEIREELRIVTYKIVIKNERIKLLCPAKNREFVPEEISAQILRKLARDASTHSGEEVTQAVITVPAYFNDSQRQATQDAGKIAGLEVLRIVNEPTAAALAYGLERKTEETILVFDLGGGTFDVSILEISDGVFEVLATSGDSQLGGDDFDEKIVQWLINEFIKEHNEPGIMKDSQALKRLMEAAEQAKIELSALTESSINLPFLMTKEIQSDSKGEKDKPASVIMHLEKTLTKSKFEDLCSGLIKRCRIPIERALKDAKLKPTAIDETVLVGGSTRILAVQNLIQDLLGKAPNQSVNPDEVVALGAAIQGGVLGGEIKGLVIKDRTPLSLGVQETEGGFTQILWPSNTVIPMKGALVLTNLDTTNSKFRQLPIEFRVLQENTSLGKFTLKKIRDAPRGTSLILVIIEIDSNGVLSIKAKDTATNNDKEITISGASTLSKDEVERLSKQNSDG